MKPKVCDLKTQLIPIIMLLAIYYMDLDTREIKLSLKKYNN